MSTISPHTTRANGTILTAAIYNADHNNHISNANALNADKVEGPGTSTPGNMAVWDDATGQLLADGGPAGTMAGEDAADYPTLAGANVFTNSNTFTGDQTITSTDAGATAAPSLILRRNSASPAANDLIGQILFRGRDTAPGDQDYAAIVAEILDATSASEDARLLLQTVVAGALATRGFVGQGLVLGAPTGGDQGVGTINATELYKNGVREWTTVIKATDEARASNTTLTNDAALLFAMAASTNYAFQGTILYDTNGTADFKYGVAGPAAPTLVQIRDNGIDPGGTIVSTLHRTVFGYSQSLAGAAGLGSVLFNGIIRNGANAGNLVFQWAQNTSNAGATTVRAGSFLEFRQL